MSWLPEKAVPCSSRLPTSKRPFFVGSGLGSLFFKRASTSPATISCWRGPYFPGRCRRWERHSRPHRCLVIVVNVLKFLSSLCLWNVIVLLAGVGLGSQRLFPPHSTSQFRHIESRRVFVRSPPVWNVLTLRSATPSRSTTPSRSPTPIKTWWGEYLIH